MELECILYEKADSIAKITLNRPQKLNALNAILYREIPQAFTEARKDPEVRVVILKGAGRAFCVGDDISEEAAQQLTLRQDIERMAQLFESWKILWNSNKPLIGQLHGYCLGAGFEMVLYCDILVSSEDCQIGNPPARFLGTLAQTATLTYLVGPMWAKRLVFTGDTIDGKTAERIGLVLSAVPADKLDEEVMSLSRRMAGVSPELMACHKLMVNRTLEAMGRGIMGQFGTEIGVIAHAAEDSVQWLRIAREKGVKAALDWNKAKFEDDVSLNE